MVQFYINVILRLIVDLTVMFDFFFRETKIFQNFPSLRFRPLESPFSTSFALSLDSFTNTHKITIFSNK